LRHKIKINGGQKAKSRCADCGSADYERCSYLGLVVCLKRQRALRHFRFNLGREPACIEVAIVVKEGSEPTPIVTKFKRIRVTIARGKTQARFLDIEGGLSFPPPSSAELAAYVVYVGFDEIRDKNEANLASTTKKPARR